MLSDGAAVSYDNEFFPCTGHGHVHPADIRKKTNIPFFIGSYQADIDNITLLPLERINGTDEPSSPAPILAEFLPPAICSQE